MFVVVHFGTPLDCGTDYDYEKRGGHAVDVEFFEQEAKAVKWLEGHPCKMTSHFHVIEGERRVIAEAPPPPVIVLNRMPAEVVETGAAAKAGI